MADREQPLQQKQKHFLVVTYPLQSHIKPALNLAKRLALAASASATFSTTIAAHRRMFPSSSSSLSEHGWHDGLLAYAPFSDGHDRGWDAGAIPVPDVNRYMSELQLYGSRHLSDLLRNFAARGRPVSSIIYSLLLPWAADVARRHGIPSTLYCIQAASVFAVYYHYFHGYDGVISAHRHDPSFAVSLPGLAPHRIRDFPSFLFDSADETAALHSVWCAIRDLIAALDKEEESTGAKPAILVNTFRELELPELASMKEHLEMVPVGPVLPSLFDPTAEQQIDTRTDENGGDIFKHDEKRYVEWLDTKPEGSVVYVSFGSLSTVQNAQLEELLRGLEECGSPYIWVVRRDNRGEGVPVDLEKAENGLVVEWCDQVKVLSHRAVGCFVTHCGWNSVLESVACGVPMVAAPGFSDQGMNARLAAEEWGTAVRARLNAEGVLEREELKRCLEAVSGEGESAAEMRKRAEMWRERAREAVSKGGSSDRNLTAYVESIHLNNHS